MPSEDPVKQCGTLVDMIHIAEDNQPKRAVLIRNHETGRIDVQRAASILKSYIDYHLKEFKLTSPPENHPAITNYAINEFAVVYQLSGKEIKEVIRKFAADNRASNLEISLYAVKY